MAETSSVAIRLGKQAHSLELAARSVLLCDDDTIAERVTKALAEAGITVVDGDDAPRGRLAEALGRKVDGGQVERILAGLHLEPDVLDWRPRELGALHRLVAGTVRALANGDTTIAYNLTAVGRSPFDVAHACAHLRRLADSFRVTVVAVIVDPALLSSAGDHCIVFEGDRPVDSGPLAGMLANPQAEHLIERLEATPIASPVAMQMRRVQRMATRPVNYAHTTIIQLPTVESVALAGGEEEPDAPSDVPGVR